MGRLAMRKLHRLIAGEVEVPVKSTAYGQLIIRNSCGAADPNLGGGKDPASVSALSHAF